MRSDFDGWILDVAKRAGLGEVPVAAIGAVAAVAVIGIGLAAWRFWPSPQSVSLEQSGQTAAVTSVAAGAPAAESSATSTAAVHVVGAVRDPGVFELPEGSRVADAIDRAGGMLPDAVPSAINLARPIADGEQILVPDEDAVKAGEAAASSVTAAGGSSGAAAGAGHKVDINSADVAALDALPGVGPSTAEKIIAEREANGPFATVDDLGRVSGIGPKRLEQLRDLVSVGP